LAASLRSLKPGFGALGNQRTLFLGKGGIEV
jgi:hypothetical protein